MTTQYVNERHAAIATDELEDARREAITAVKEQAAAFLDIVPTNQRHAVTAITDAGEQAVTVAKRAAREIHAAQNNLDIHPDGRAARARAAREEGEKKLNDLYGTARAQVQILSAALEGEALAPPEGAANAALARQDAALALGVAKNPVRALETLASDPDLGVATLVASPWGRRYLTAIGAEDTTTIMDGVKQTALENIAQNGDSTSSRTRAAQARLDITRLDTVVAGYESLTTGILS